MSNSLETTSSWCLGFEALDRFRSTYANSFQTIIYTLSFPHPKLLLTSNLLLSPTTRQNCTMSFEDRANPLTESSMTIPSDSEQYSGNDESSPSPPSSSSSPMILYSPPTIWGLIRGAAINLLLPFVNGLMLGFGELFAHEAAYRLGWGGTKVRFLDYCWGSKSLPKPFWLAIIVSILRA